MGVHLIQKRADDTVLKLLDNVRELAAGGDIHSIAVVYVTAKDIGSMYCGDRLQLYYGCGLLKREIEDAE